MTNKLQDITSLIKEKKLIKEGQIIGIGVSGGMDSMTLLHLLMTNQKELGYEILVINIDHMIRENSANDSAFVVDYCKKNSIKVHCFNVDTKKFSAENKMSLELAARQLRYGVFDALIKKGIVNKIALAHHQNDQVETILMNLFRGTGTSGIQGMEHERKDGFIRPLLTFSREHIEDYVKENKVPYVTDQTNEESIYNRNFLRNQILPLILSKWPNALSSITNFALDVALDDKYISKNLVTDAILFDDNVAKIPTSYFLQDIALVSRMIFNTVKKIGIKKDFERKHINLLLKLAQNEQTGSKLDFPCGLKAVKEYDYITLINRQKEKLNIELPFKVKKTNFASQILQVKKIKKEDFIKTEGNLIFDLDKLPHGALWRTKKEGDLFCKFGGGTKKLKSYLVDKKIPARLRQTLPILAVNNEVYLIAGVEISDKIKVDENSKNCVEIVTIK